MSERTYRLLRIIDYYDLIEFPSGRHIPVPLAIKWFGWKDVLKIPVAEKKRDEWFYYCPECETDYWNDLPWWDGPEPGYSFFKCQIHNERYGKDTEIKKTLLDAFFKAGLHNCLKYIEVDPKCRFARRRGFAAIVEVGHTGFRFYGDFKHALGVSYDGIGLFEFSKVDWLVMETF